jgi:membrane-bound serine protease (ClpP class)
MAMNWIEFFSGLQWLMALLFILGSILIVVELMMPGFGIAGALGIISLLAGVLVASQIVSSATLMGIIVVVLLVIVGTLVWIYRSATKGGRVSRTLLLHSKMDNKEGYTSVRPPDALLGKEGVALSMLRPAGLAEIGDRRVDVVTEGEFIPKGTKIKVVQVEGFRIVVERVE